MLEYRKAESKHLQSSDLPEDKKNQQLSPHRKCLKDCVSMIAYRTETAMAALLRPILRRPMEERPLLYEIFRSAVMSSSHDKFSSEQNSQKFARAP